MNEYGISKYEELMKKYKRTIQDDPVDMKEYMILDETGLGLDESLEFCDFKNSKLLECKLDLFEKVELIFDSRGSDCGFEFVKFTFEDLDFYENNFLYKDLEDWEDVKTGWIKYILEVMEFVILKGKFRISFEFDLEVKTKTKVKEKVKRKRKTQIIEIEARYLTIEKMDNFEFKSNQISCDEIEMKYDGMEIIYSQKKVDSLVENLKISRKKAMKLSDFYDEYKNYEYRFSNVYRGIIIDKKGNFNLEHIKNLYSISEGLKSLLTDMYLIWSKVISCGKTNLDDEFYIVFHLNESYMTDGSYFKYDDYEHGDGVFDELYERKCSNEIVLVKFKGVSFLKGIDLIGESIGYNYVEVNPDNIDFRIGNKNAEFFTIHARDVEVDILDDCRRFFEWPTYWNNLENK